MRKLLPLCLILIASLETAAQSSCNAGRALVSGYYSNVHVYDACSGDFERVLDSDNRISGAQAVWPRPDGRVYVVSENNGRILRYQSDSLAYIDTFIDTGAAFKPTGIAFAPDGDLYVAGFDADEVRRYDGQTGTLKSTPVPARAGGLDGPDNGMTFGPDGKLYIPGYYSNNVLRYDPVTNQLSTFVTAGSGGLRRTRAILFEPGNAHVLVSSEGSSQILRFNAGSGALVGTFASLPSPAGMNYSSDGRLLVATNSSIVQVLNASTGATQGTLFPITAGGGLQGATYVVTMPAKVDLAQVGSQYWLIGAGQVHGRQIEFDLVSATGTRFGDAFRPTDVVRKRWGSIRIAFTSCESADFSWNSTGPDSAGFGSGGYALQSLVGTAFTDQCKLQPFDQVNGSDFMNGTWYGGASRSGEGLLITVNASGLATVAMFTHQPVRY
jgi:streptogramin lyase